MLSETIDLTDELKSPDESNRASAIELLRATEGLQRVQQQLKPQSHPDFDGETCLDCGAVMPDQRLADGRIRCTECETAREKRGKMFGAH